MKFSIALSVAVAIILAPIAINGMKKCYYLIERCPRVTAPCPIPSICINGTLRQQNGSCCCVPQCGENEIFMDEARITADPTCDIQSAFPSIMGGPSGCFCLPGFVRNKQNKCVHLDDCPKPITVCHQNETYSDCGQIESCEPTCMNPVPIDMCPPICKKGCFCKDEFVRDKQKRCIRLEDCPDPECGKNQEYLKCNPNCGDPTCETPRAYYCGLQCSSGCFCMKGYVKNKEGKCIPPDQCPNHDKHEL